LSVLKPPPLLKGYIDRQNLVNEPISVEHRDLPESGDQRIQVGESDPLHYITADQLQRDTRSAGKGFHEELRAKVVLLQRSLNVPGKTAL